MQVEKANVKELKRIIESNYGSEFSFKNYNVYTNKSGRIFIVSKHIPQDLAKHAIGFGLHFGTLKKGGKIHLTIEGSQLVGPTAKKNIVLLEKDEIFRFIEGMSVSKFKPINCELKNFVIITDGKDFFGSGIFRGNYIESLVPKGRRIMTSLKKT